MEPMSKAERVLDLICAAASEAAAMTPLPTCSRSTTGRSL
jgi:hypothetical protein